MSDSYFIGTVARVHNLWRFTTPADRIKEKVSSTSHPMVQMEKDENSEAHKQRPRATIGMMVSLDHTIYFHRPREIKADGWLLSENESPWSGDGRGLVLQRIWNKEGLLVASCVQEVSCATPPDVSSAIKPSNLPCLALPTLIYLVLTL